MHDFLFSLIQLCLWQHCSIFPCGLHVFQVKITTVWPCTANYIHVHSTSIKAGKPPGSDEDRKTCQTGHRTGQLYFRESRWLLVPNGTLACYRSFYRKDNGRHFFLSVEKEWSWLLSALSLCLLKLTLFSLIHYICRRSIWNAGSGMRSGSVSLTQMTDFNTGTENPLGYSDHSGCEMLACAFPSTMRLLTVVETVLGEGWGNATVTHWRAWAFKPSGVLRPNRVLDHTADLANHLGNLFIPFDWFGWVLSHSSLATPSCLHSPLYLSSTSPQTLVVLNTKSPAPVPFPYFFLTASPF